jgi:hypothetical protein
VASRPGRLDDLARAGMAAHLGDRSGRLAGCRISQAAGAADSGAWAQVPARPGALAGRAQIVGSCVSTA